MMFEEGHPIVPLSDWEAFKAWETSRGEYSRARFDEVIDRNEAKLPDWFVPLARGIAIASDALLRQIGHRPGMRRPRGWFEANDDCFKRLIGWPGAGSLFVRECEETKLWTVERLGAARQYEVDEVLVFTFGWTPIFARSYKSAMRIAMHCHKKGPP